MIASNDIAGVARIWAREVIGVSCVPMAQGEVEAFLGECLHELVVSLVADRLDTRPATEVGARLVRRRFTQPEVLEGTFALFVTELPRVLSLPRIELLPRLSVVLGALAAGYAQQLRETTLDEQEVITQAVIRARESAEEALRASEARFRAVFTSSALGIAIADLDGNVLETNRALHGIVGATQGENVIGSVYDLAAGSGLPDLRVHEADLADGTIDRFQVITRFRGTDQADVWTQLSGSLVRDACGEPDYQVLLVENVTERVMLQDGLHRQATHDPLTGLPNRTLLANRLEEALLRTSPQRRVALCYFDLDGFKAINDSLGHSAGDDLLRVVAQRMQQVAAAEGATAVRMGGDEFVLLVPDSPGTVGVVAVVERVLAELTRPTRISGHELAAEASVGIVERPVAGIDADELLRDADLTLYRAKHEGRGQWVLSDPEHNAALRQRSTLSAALPAALQRNQLFVEYEPILWLETTALVAVEATARWDHPDLGELDAERFLGPAANTGLSTRLGSWMLERVCEHAQRWTERVGSAAPVPCMDLSPHHFRDPELVSDVQRILRETGLPAEYLALGVPEAALFDHHDHPVDTLEIFTDMGLRLGVHDFGRGHAHLPRLRNLPIQAVKITGDFLDSFADPTGPDPLDKHLVTSLVGSAHLLGLFVIADGVHTEEQAKRLQHVGVHGAKGDYAGGLASAMEIEAAITHATGCLR